MNIFTFLLLVLIPISTVIGCSRLGYKKEKDVEEIILSTGCLNLSKEIDYVINDESSYLALIDTFIPNYSSPGCEDYTLPDIDFSTVTLLGKYASGGGCSIDFKRTVLISEKEKEYKYIIKVKEKGSCLMFGSSWNLITVPKLPSDYTVKFEVK